MCSCTLPIKSCSRKDNRHTNTSAHKYSITMAYKKYSHVIVFIVNEAGSEERDGSVS